ncbi:flavodoxin family protein [Actinomyces gerencseriae]|uniref:flavodoxin family protein n=1 Tax=Actinomyces gerencseriae TaxID=52769 RepID=UPI0023EF734E|nr:NAD(P)H-dependent oxidoreductase [Actinomyces gerencseriae]
MTTAPRILIVFSSLFGANAELARLVEQTVTRAGAQGRTRGVPQLVLADRQVPQAQAPSATSEDLDWADGLIFSSPSHTGLPSAAIKAFIDEHHEAAVKGKYVNKTFTAMSTSGYAHAGQEGVVNDLNAAAAAWGCIIVPPSTANAQINQLDGNPYGLSFILTNGKLPDTETIRTLLQTHLERFVMITQSVSGMPHAAHHASATAPSASRARATDVFG